MRTQKERFESACVRLSKVGVTVTLLHDDTSIVRSDAVEAYQRAAVRAGTPGRWAGAGAEGSFWSGGVLRQHVSGLAGSTAPVEALLFSFPHTETFIAGVVCASFAADGFAVEWDGDPRSCVRVALI